jgi:hypothetical protein
MMIAKVPMKTRMTQFLNRIINMLAMGIFLASFAFSPVSAGSLKFPKIKKEISKVVKSVNQDNKRSSVGPTPIADDSPIDPSKKDSVADKKNNPREKR